MLSYLSGQAVKLVIDLPVAKQTQAVSYRLLNQIGEILIPKQTVTVSQDEPYTVELLISATHNSVTPAGSREIRLAEVYVTSETGTIKIERAYALEAEDIIIKNVNSFQAYPAAIYTALGIPSVTAWSEAERNERMAALISARKNIGLLHIKDALNGAGNIIDVTSMSAAEFDNLPDALLESLCRAQVIEANYLLMNENGFFDSEESTGSNHVCKSTLRELSKWLSS